MHKKKIIVERKVPIYVPIRYLLWVPCKLTYASKNPFPKTLTYYVQLNKLIFTTTTITTIHASTMKQRKLVFKNDSLLWFIIIYNLL
jgi:hypothetical protein